jgi:hypothetical protein
VRRQDQRGAGLSRRPYARAGLQAGVSIDRCALGLRLGLVRDSAGEAPTLPFYATIALGARF